MRRILQLAVGALLVGVLAALIAETTLGQSGPNAVCPFLQTDAKGNPLNPPYSQYATDAHGTTVVNGKLFDLKAPCCGTVTVTTDSGTGVSTSTAALSGVAATWNPDTASSFCQPPDFDLGIGPNPADSTFLNAIVNPFFGHHCPQNVNFVLTMEDTNGAVRNCIPPPPTDPGPSGGSNFSNATGGNAG